MEEDQQHAFRQSDGSVELDELNAKATLSWMKLPIRPKVSRVTESRKQSGWTRKASVFEENAFHEILKERRHDTIIQVLHTDKSELDEDEEVFEEPLTWKPGPVKQKLANTYKMVPDKKFNFAAVAKRVDKLLEDRLRNKDLDSKQFKALALSLSDDIKSIAKELAPERFKLIARVLMGNLKNQSLTIASKFLWDPEHDSWCESQFKTSSFFVMVTVYAVYFE